MNEVPARSLRGAPRMGGTAFADLGAFLSREDLLVLSSERRRALYAEWRDIDLKERGLDDRLVVGLIGGTGVGKSTFINALARESVSASGDRRPTTDRVIVYRHRVTELPESVPRGDLAEPEVLHDTSELARVVILDFPDFDSVEASHRAILLRYLPAIDVLFVLADDVKYADERLYRLLRDLEHDERNLFAVINKLDRLRARYRSDAESVAEEMLDDFHLKLAKHGGLDLERTQLYSISALDEWRESRGEATSGPTGIGRIRELLDSYREEKRRREAKRLNLGSRAERLESALSREVLEGEPPRLLERASDHLAGWSEELEAILEALPREVLTMAERRAIRAEQVRRSASSYGAPVSLFLTLFGEIAHWRQRGQRHALDAGSLASRIEQHYRAYLDGLGNLRAKFRSDFAGTALAGSGLHGVPSADEAGPWAARLASRLSGELARSGRDPADVSEPGEKGSSEERTRKPRPPRRWVYHLPAAAVLFGSLWSLAYAPIRAAFSSERGFGGVLAEIGRSILDALSPVFLLGIVFGVILAYLAAAIWIWLRETQRLDQAARAAEIRLRQEVRERGSGVLQALEELTSRYRAQIEEVRGLVRRR